MWWAERLAEAVWAIWRAPGLSLAASAGLLAGSIWCRGSLARTALLSASFLTAVVVLIGWAVVLLPALLL